MESENVCSKINLFINLAPITKIGNYDENKLFRATSKHIPALLRAHKTLGYVNMGTNMSKVKERLRYFLSDA